MSAVELETAVRLLQSAAKPVEEVIAVDISEARGYVLAEDIRSAMPQPPFDRSPLDGYALRAEDTRGASRETPVRLKVIDKIMAGSVSGQVVASGTAVRLMTGAPIPKGADCVIRQEMTDYGEQEVSVYQELRPHDNICDQGEDYPAGTLLMEQGEKLDAVAVGILAGSGIRTVRVYRKLRVALITSGDEVAEPGEGCGPGKIYNTNRFLIRGRLEELGIVPVFCCHVADDVEKASDVIGTAAELADLVLTTGGVSVGQKDIMHDVEERLNAEHLFWRVAFKPGSPALAYQVGQTVVISMSGNPFGALVNFEMMARPVLAHLAHQEELAARCFMAETAGTFRKASPMRRLIRARYQDGVVEIPETGHSSGMLSGMKGCNCLADIPAGHEALKPGEMVRVWMIR